MMKLTQNTTIFSAGCDSTAITYAIQSLIQDMAGIFGREPVMAHELLPDQIRITVNPTGREEAFSIQCDRDNRCVLIDGNDDLGAIFGIYYFCEHWLDVDPFRFWTDFPYHSRNEIDLPAFEYTSPEPNVRFRGWFINDEDCLIGWHDDMKISLATWKQVFETLLRTGFNMIIPGTGTGPEAPQLQLAADMGLWLTHHHAEPLGARLFSDAYPGIPPLIPEEIERFTALYRDAINIQKDRKVLWSLGFRGQGDLPFFRTDPRYSSPQMRGKIISDMIRLQKRLIADLTKGPHYFVHNLYSESAQLYRDGHLELDDDIIRVWADNGFGAMRARREWGTDPNISSMPLPIDKNRLSGVYYHLSFHDLQLASKLTPIVNPDLIQDQFQQLFEKGNIQYLTLNVSNIRPHVFNIDLIGKLIRFYRESFPAPISPVEQHYADWTHKYFSGYERAIADLIKRYYQTPFHYGPFADDVAGEQVCHHGLRNAINAVVTGENAWDWSFTFHYISDPVTTNRECFQWILERAESTLPAWKRLQTDAETLLQKLEGYQAQYFSDSVRMQIDFMAYSYHGLVSGLKGLIAYLDGDYKQAFCLLSQSKWFMEDAWKTLVSTEHGKWKNFFRGEWLTGTRETIRRLETIRGICKIRADVEKKGIFPAWIAEALGLEEQSSIHTIMQANTDYDTLAAALLKKKQGIF